MAQSLWPRYGTSAARPRVLAGFLFNLQAAKVTLILLAAVAVYFVGISMPIPTLRPAEGTPISSWWFLRLFDLLFTGGALGRGAFFCLGLFSTFALGSTVTNVAQAARKGLLLRILKLSVLTALIVLIFLLRGNVAVEVRAIAVTFFSVALGGVGLALINRVLMRHRGPQIIHLNIFILLYSHYSGVFLELRSLGRLSDLYLSAAGIGFIAVSAYYVFKRRIFIEIENIKSPADHRFATLELRGVDEDTLDLLAFASVILFICFAGVVSLLADFRQISQDNFLVFAGISTVLLLSVWLLLVLASKVLASHGTMVSYISQFLDTGEMLAFHDARHYALLMLNSFWVIPNVAAGPATEEFIRERVKRVMHKSFLIFAVWFFVILGIQLYIFFYSSGLLLFPYGPLVFIFLFLMCVGNLSMILRNVRMKFGHYRQLMRGRQRVLVGPYSLATPSELRHVDFSKADDDYWDEEKLSDQVKQIIDWYQLIRQVQVIPSKSVLPKRTRIAAALWQLIIGIISGIIIAFLGGGLYVLLVPQRGDVWAVVIPLFLGGLFSQNILWSVLKRKHQ